MLQIILGGVLVFLGVILINAANMLHFQAEADVLEKRPGVADELYTWGIFRKHRLVERFYRSEFPDGKRILQCWMCAIGGLTAVASGVAVILTKIK